MKGRYVALTTAALAATLAVVPSIAVTGTQQTDETTRQIIAEEFLKKRPAAGEASCRRETGIQAGQSVRVFEASRRRDDGAGSHAVAVAAVAIVG